MRTGEADDRVRYQSDGRFPGDVNRERLGAAARRSIHLGRSLRSDQSGRPLRGDDPNVDVIAIDHAPPERREISPCAHSVVAWGEQSQRARRERLCDHSAGTRAAEGDRGMPGWNWRTRGNDGRHDVPPCYSMPGR